MKKLAGFSIFILALIAIIIFALLKNMNTIDYDISVVYSGMLMGELEPCGCAEETDMGGIRRRAKKIEDLRKKEPNVIVISAGGEVNNNGWQDKIKAEYIFKALGMMNYDGVGLQYRDLSYGEKFAKQFGGPWVASTLEDDGFEYNRQYKRKNITVNHFAWVDSIENHPDEGLDNIVLPEHRQQNDSIALNDALKDSKANGNVNIVSSSITINKLMGLISLKNVDLVLLPNKNEECKKPELINETLLLSYGKRGMCISKIDLELDETNGKIVTYDHSVIKLGRSVKNSERFLQWYESYNNKVKEKYNLLSEERKKIEANMNIHVGKDTCKMCHVTQGLVWERSKHAKAFKTLEKVNKQFDPSCIQCHTVGFNEPGGFIDISVTRFLTNVQCESCHGAGRDHVNSGGAVDTIYRKKPFGEVCNQCHIGDHSPTFVFEEYWEDILH